MILKTIICRGVFSREGMEILIEGESNAEFFHKLTDGRRVSPGEVPPDPDLALY